MKRRQLGVGVLVLFCVLFFCLGIFLSSSWNTLCAQYQGGERITGGTVPLNYNQGYNGNTVGMSGLNIAGGVGGEKTNPALTAVAGGQPVNVARPLEVPPLYAFGSMVSDSCQQVVLVDSKTKRICVYYVRSRENKSTIEMVASRNFEWDLKLDDFNGEGISSMQIKEQVLKSGEKH